MRIGLKAAGQLHVAGDLVGSEFRCARLDFAAEHLAVTDPEDICLGFVFMVLAGEPDVDSREECDFRPWRSSAAIVRRWGNTP